jgi:hypothetical protein
MTYPGFAPISPTSCATFKAPSTAFLAPSTAPYIDYDASSPWLSSED